MPIKVLLADDSDIMVSAIVGLLREEPTVECIGSAGTFAMTMQMIADFKPDVLLLDLHLPEGKNFTPEFIKSQLACVPHMLALSFSNDDEAKALAKAYGARGLLDKMNLFGDMIPAILRLHRDSSNIPAPPKLLNDNSKKQAA